MKYFDVDVMLFLQCKDGPVITSPDPESFEPRLQKSFSQITSIQCDSACAVLQIKMGNNFRL